jgi:DNA topoisomerase-1
MKRGKRVSAVPVADAAAAARAAGLRYVHDDALAIRRVRRERGFGYVGPDGRPVADADTLARIRSLVLPPAWGDVRICVHARGHLQAVGRDKKGRKQYRYHPLFRAVRDQTKYGRMAAFGAALPRLRARTAADLALPGLPREKVLAAVVRLLERSLIRVGNEEYARANGSYGLTTLRARHVAVEGSLIRFRFRGKSGVRRSIDLRDRQLARVVRRCQDLPGQELFQYLDEAGEAHTIGSADVNAYLHAVAGDELTAKDFRTWAGSVLAAEELAAMPFASQAEAKRNVAAAVAAAARRLGNTRAVCRKSYVHPAVVMAYLEGALAAVAVKQEEPGPNGLRPEEARLLALLRRPAAAPG